MPDRFATEFVGAELVASRALAELAAGFAAALRARGVPVVLSSVMVFRAAIAEMAPFGSQSIYWAGRSIFVHRPDEVVGYDEAYGAFFGNFEPIATPITPFDVVPVALEGEEDSSLAPSEIDADLSLPGAMAEERLATKDFASLSDTEVRIMHRLMQEIAMDVTQRMTRRHLRAGVGRSSIDLRASARRSVRMAGEVLPFEQRRRRMRPQRLVAICDISGSMDPYAREFVRFLQVCVGGRPDVEAFALGTRLTRLTRTLTGHDPDGAIERVATEVRDWSGGTLLGSGLKAFNDRFGIRGMGRGAVILICSDGIDRGDPDLLSSELARLRQVARRIVWVNPLKASPGYQPTARGMAAAMPYLDEFLPGHSLEALTRVAKSVVM